MSNWCVCCSTIWPPPSSARAHHGGRRCSAEPARDDQRRRPLGEQVAELRDELHRPQLIADRRHETAGAHGRRDLVDGLIVGRGERLLGQERHPARDEEPANGGSAERRQADDDRVRAAPRRAADPPTERRPAVLARDRLGSLGMLRNDADDLRSSGRAEPRRCWPITAPVPTRPSSQRLRHRRRVLSNAHGRHCRGTLARMADASEPFVLGVNYWPRRKAMEWWKRFDRGEVREEFELIRELGLTKVRIFLLWEDFQPAPDRVSTKALDHLVAVGDAAADRGLGLDVTFFTGHMSGPNWAPGWLLDREGEKAPGGLRVISGERVTSQRLPQPLRRPLALAAERLLLREVVGLLMQHPAVWLWNLGNEPDLFALPPTSAAGAGLGGESHGADPRARRDAADHARHARREPEADNGLRVDAVFETCDFSVMHAYPVYATWAASPTDPELVPFVSRADRRAVGQARARGRVRRLHRTPGTADADARMGGRRRQAAPADAGGRGAGHVPRSGAAPAGGGRCDRCAAVVLRRLRRVALEAAAARSRRGTNGISGSSGPTDRSNRTPRSSSASRRRSRPSGSRARERGSRSPARVLRRPEANADRAVPGVSREAQRIADSDLARGDGRPLSRLPLVPYGASVLLMLSSAACIVAAALACTLLMSPAGLVAWIAVAYLMALAIVMVVVGFCGLVLRDLSPASITLVSVVVAGLALGAAAPRLRRMRRTAAPIGAGRRAKSAFRDWLGWLPAILVTAVVLVALGWRTVIALRLGVLDFDAFLYHLLTADVWLQANALVSVPQDRWAAGNPHDGELLIAWLMAFPRSDALAGLASVVAVPLLAIGVVGLSRFLGASRRAAVLAGGLVSLMPVVQWLMGTSHVDTLGTAAVLIAWWFGLWALEGRWSLGTLIVFGVAAGMAMGTKVSFAILIAPLGLVVAAAAFRAPWGESRRPRAVAQRLLAISVPVLVLGASWYLKNLLIYGNPLYPVAFGPFPGPASMAALTTTPRSSRFGLPGNIAISWLADWWETRYHDGRHPGGFGRAWLPMILLAVASIPALLRRPTGRRYLVLVLVPVAIGLVVLPQTDEARQSLWLAAALAPLFAVAVTALAERVPRLAVVAAGLVLVVLAVWSAAYADLRPNAKLRTEAGTRVKSVRQYATLVLFGSDAERRNQAFWGDCAGYSMIPDGSVVVPAGATLLHAVVGSNLQRALAAPLASVSSAAELENALRAQGAFLVRDPSERLHLRTRGFGPGAIRRSFQGLRVGFAVASSRRPATVSRCSAPCSHPEPVLGNVQPP